MRKDAVYNRPEITTIQGYHGGDFKQLTAYVSDRKLKMDDDYTVSADNTDAILKLYKVGEHLPLIGIELENHDGTEKFDPYHNPQDALIYTNLLNLIFEKAGFDPDFFKTEKDCTVSAECITQTFSFSWLRNHYVTFKAMWELFRAFGITTNHPSVGMHVNLDLANFGKDRETQIDNVRKLGYFINKNYDLCKTLFNRVYSTMYCPKMNDSKEYWKTTETYRFPISHSGCCINMGHLDESRVEIRLVGGQKDYACFRNTMETIYHLINAICKLSWDDIDDLFKVFKGCNNYVDSRLERAVNENRLSRDVYTKIHATMKPAKFTV